jgi:hypothetical protein
MPELALVFSVENQEGYKYLYLFLFFGSTYTCQKKNLEKHTASGHKIVRLIRPNYAYNGRLLTNWRSL